MKPCKAPDCDVDVNEAGRRSHAPAARPGMWAVLVKVAS